MWPSTKSPDETLSCYPPFHPSGSVPLLSLTSALASWHWPGQERFKLTTIRAEARVGLLDIVQALAQDVSLP